MMRLSPTVLVFPILASLAGCSSDPEVLAATPVARTGFVECSPGAKTDLVTAATLNMAVGFDVKDLLFINPDSTRVFYGRARKIFDDCRASLPRERVRLMASEIHQAKPEILGLQEVLYLTENGVVVADFLDTLVADLAKLGDVYQVRSRPLNREDMRIGPPDGVGDSIVLGFNEGQALLVSPRWKILSEGILTFANLIHFELQGRSQVTDRSAQWAFLSDSTGFGIEVWNTHLEILTAQMLGQVGELVGMADSLRAARGISPSGRLVLGDMNADDGSGAEDIFTRWGWKDIWDLQKYGPGPTYGGGSLHDSSRTVSKRYDRVFHQGGCQVDTVFRLGTAASRTDSGWLFPTDHVLLGARIRYGVRF